MQAPAIRPINPFSSQRTLPGAIPYLWPEDTFSLSARAQNESRLNTLAIQILGNRRMAIQGPHGSGKSTLLASLIPHLHNYLDKQRLRHWVLHNDCRQKDWLRQIRQIAPTLPQSFASSRESQTGEAQSIAFYGLQSPIPSGLLIVDGYEQLTWYGRQTLGRLQKKLDWHLLITTHKPVRGFDNLLSTSPSRSTAERLVGYLIDAYPESQAVIQQAFLEAWDKSAGDFRQLWSLLYDSYEDYLNREGS